MSYEAVGVPGTFATQAEAEAAARALHGAADETPVAKRSHSKPTDPAPEAPPAEEVSTDDVDS